MPALPEWQSPRERDHPRVGQIIDVHQGTPITLEQLLVALADAPIVLPDAVFASVYSAREATYLNRIGALNVMVFDIKALSQPFA